MTQLKETADTSLVRIVYSETEYNHIEVIINESIKKFNSGNAEDDWVNALVYGQKNSQVVLLTSSCNDFVFDVPGYKFEESPLFGEVLKYDYSDKWPDKPGEYWFYGWLSGKTKEGKPELVLVEAFRGASSLVFASREGYVYKADAIGLWKPARLQKPPNDEAMKELLKNRKEKE